MSDSGNAPAQRTPWYRGSRGEYYVIVQGLLFVLIALGPPTWPGLPEWSPLASTIGTWLGLVLMFAGLTLALAGLLRLGSNLSVLPAPRDCSDLVTGGAYALVRNPIYSGLIIGAFGWGLWRHGWLTLVYAAALFILFDAKSRLEERWLAEKFGAPYAEYRARVRKLIPWLY